MTVDSFTQSSSSSSSSPSSALIFTKIPCNRLQSIPFDAIYHSMIMNGNVYRKFNQINTPLTTTSFSFTNGNNNTGNGGGVQNVQDELKNGSIVIVRGIRYKCNENGSLTKMDSNQSIKLLNDHKAVSRNRQHIHHQNLTSFASRLVPSSSSSTQHSMLHSNVCKDAQLNNRFKLNRNACSPTPPHVVNTRTTKNAITTTTSANNTSQQNGLRSKYKLVTLTKNKSLPFNACSSATKPLHSRYKLVRNVSTFKKVFNRHSPVKTMSISMPKKEEQSTLVGRLLSMKSIKSSINRLRKKTKSKQSMKLVTNNQKFCMFFCRYGRCANVRTCPFKHDPEKVAICTRFLRGTCKINNCPFSHKLSPDKMPVCSFFLKGVCNNDSCPYRHVKVAEHAQICPDFDRGYCDKGDQCKLLHQYSCSKCSSSKKSIKRCSDCQSIARGDSPIQLPIRTKINKKYTRRRSVTSSSSSSSSSSPESNKKKKKMTMIETLDCDEEEVKISVETVEQNGRLESSLVEEQEEEEKRRQGTSLLVEKEQEEEEEEKGSHRLEFKSRLSNKLPAFIPLFLETSAKVDRSSSSSACNRPKSASPLPPPSSLSTSTTTSTTGQQQIRDISFCAYDSDDTWYEGESEEDPEELIPFVPAFLYHLD